MSQSAGDLRQWWPANTETYADALFLLRRLTAAERLVVDILCRRPERTWTAADLFRAEATLAETDVHDAVLRTARLAEALGYLSPIDAADDGHFVDTATASLFLRALEDPRSVRNEHS